MIMEHFRVVKTNVGRFGKDVFGIINHNHKITSNFWFSTIDYNLVKGLTLFEQILICRLLNFCFCIWVNHSPKPPVTKTAAFTASVDQEVIKIRLHIFVLPDILSILSVLQRSHEF